MESKNDQVFLDILIQRDTFDLKWLAARDEDWGRYGTEKRNPDPGDYSDYLEIFDIARDAKDVREFFLAQDLFKSIASIRQRIAQVRGKNQRFVESSLLNWAEAFLDRMESIAEVLKKKKARKKKVARVVGISADFPFKRLNERIMAVFENKKPLNEVLNELRDLLHTIYKELNLVNVATCLLNLGNVTDPNISGVSVDDDFDEFIDVFHEIFGYLEYALEHSEDDFDDQGIANGLYGLRNLNPRLVPESFVSLLLSRVRSSEGVLSIQGASAALFGITCLKGLNGVDDIVEELVDAHLKARFQRDSVKLDPTLARQLKKALNIHGVDLPGFEKAYIAAVHS